MSPAADSTCPACGASASGRFCARCGTALGARACPACAAPLAPGARFCGACGAALGAAAPAAPAAPAPPPAAARPALLPFALAGVAVVVALVVFLMPKQPVPAAASGAPLGGAAPVVEPPPLLDGLSARDRFDTLYNRTMRASERGDALTAGQYAPQALQAYAALDAVDADARYHAAMIRLHTGDVAGARAIADTILAQQPSHLFGFVLRGTVARSGGDTQGLAAALADYLRHYDAEMAAGRPEYGHHGFILNQFLGEARGQPGPGGS